MINNKLVQLGYAKWSGDRIVIFRKHLDAVLDIVQGVKESVVV